METLINVPIHSVNPLVLRQWQHQFPNAQIRIEADLKSENLQMVEKKFWEIIGLLDWGRKQVSDIIAPAVKALSLHSKAEICAFDELLARKLRQLDGEAFAIPFGWNAENDAHFSVDGFLYARCCVVANGKAFFEKVRKNPASMPSECTFEPLLYLAEKAWFLKTGKDDYDHLPAVSFETFSNKKGWPGVASLKELLLAKP